MTRDLLDGRSAHAPRELRPYQIDAVRLVYDQIRNGISRVALEVATGAGKTTIAGQIVKHALSRQKRVAFVVPYLTLVDQTITSFSRDGIDDIGVI